MELFLKLWKPIYTLVIVPLFIAIGFWIKWWIDFLGKFRQMRTDIDDNSKRLDSGQKQFDELTQTIETNAKQVKDHIDKSNTLMLKFTETLGEVKGKLSK